MVDLANQLVALAVVGAAAWLVFRWFTDEKQGRKTEDIKEQGQNKHDVD